MGCSASLVAAQDEREVVDRIHKLRVDRRARGCLSRDPTSLAEYQRLLARAGAITFEQNGNDSDDDEDCGLTRARSIVVFHRANSGSDNSGWLADDAVSGRDYDGGVATSQPCFSVPSALKYGSLRSPSNCSCSNSNAPLRRLCSTLPLSQEFKRVTFDMASETSTPPPSPTHESVWTVLPHTIGS